MIPISKEQKISTVIDGIRYFAHPPVGQTEIDVAGIFDSGDINLPGLYAKAEAEIKAELKGKRMPKKAEIEKMIMERMKKGAGSDDSWKANVETMNRFIDRVICDWNDERKEDQKKAEGKCPDFPKDEKPSEMLCLAIKSRMFDWYQGHMNLTVAEGKN